MASGRSRLLLFHALLASSVAGCASESGDAARGEADPATGAEAVTAKPCLATDTSLFFHGLSGYGRELAQPGLCVPAVDNGGASGFWSDVAYTRAAGAAVVGGYSAGRIPLVRRLAKGEGLEPTAVMLDPSYADGARFDGRTGPDIVDEWLDDDAARRFVLVYLPSSAGWHEYAALRAGVHGQQVTVCPIAGGHSHLELPALVTAKLFADPDAWVAERCAR